MTTPTPPLLTFDNGSEVTAVRWPQRREELRAAIIDHEFGGMPPEPAHTYGVPLCHATLRLEGGVGFRTYEIRCVFPDQREISFSLQLWIPKGTGPFPVVLDGDGCWRYFNDDIVRRILDRGAVAASFNRTDLAADNKDRYRETGLYRLFPEAAFGAVSAWAWGYHRCIDFLESLGTIRADAIAITGHSRGGKTVLLAGALDQRVAVTNPNQSCIGGSGLNRLKGEGSETIDDFFRSGNIFWFGRGFAEYRHRDQELPYDQHFLHALVAPRGLLVHEAHGDPQANPAGSYAACLAAREVYALLGKPDEIGWTVREGTHGHLPADFDSLLDFLEPRFFGRETVRGFQRQVYCDLDAELR